MCEALNKAHNAEQTEWDLGEPVVLWAYRTACKNLIVHAPPRLEYEANVVIPIEHEMPSPCMTKPIDMKVHKTLAEQIQQGNFRLKELEKEMV